MADWIFKFVVAVVFVVVLWNLWPMSFPQTKTYNCDRAEIHPDYPPAVREQCRKLKND